MLLKLIKILIKKITKYISNILFGFNFLILKLLKLKNSIKFYIIYIY